MPAQIIDGQKIAKDKYIALQLAVAKLDFQPGIASLVTDDNSASKLYASKRGEIAQSIGMYSELHSLGKNAKDEEIVEIISSLNKNTKIHGIIVQMPLPKGADISLILSSINPKKDADAIHPLNLGNLFLGSPYVIPATAKAIFELINSTGAQIESTNVTVIGNGISAGRPSAALLQNAGATVTVCNSKTKNLKSQTIDADIIIASTGKEKILTADMVKEGAIVIDAGVSIIKGKIIGDVDFGTVSKKAAYITQVPGGVGPVTSASLLENVFSLATI
nr:bifunctional 5,10-methylenetetrahydrofolate dehydrogenase/5,10-methenyltetrahydrofolate cyclohydrolase [Candidatus Undinarchaeales archaeon ERR594346 U_76725]